jgi:hypothetical protein
MYRAGLPGTLHSARHALIGKGVRLVAYGTKHEAKN